MRQPLFPGQVVRPAPLLRRGPVRLVLGALAVVALSALSLTYAVARKADTDVGGLPGNSREGAETPAAVIYAAATAGSSGSGVRGNGDAAGAGADVSEKSPHQGPAASVRRPPRGPVRRFEAGGDVSDPLSPRDPSLPRVLVLTPVKNSADHLGRYFRMLRNLTYDAAALSLGMLDGDSTDAPTEKQAQTLLSLGYDPSDVSSMSGTLARILVEVPLMLEAGWAAVTTVSHNFNFSLPRAVRHGIDAQKGRRAVLSKSRNHLVSSALRDEDWVLWVDSDLAWYPPSVLDTLIRAALRGRPDGKDRGKPLEILVPNCVMQAGVRGRSYDLNSWRGSSSPGNNATVAAVVKYHDAVHAKSKDSEHPSRLWLEGYGPTGNLYLSKLRSEGEVVRLDAVGGAMLLVHAELHRHGLVFPPMPHRHRIETEGLSMLALDMGALSWGMPNVEIVHH
jgi:hypothetical protein